MVAAVLVSGCGSTGTTVRDLSTSEETALIEVREDSRSGCSIIGPLPIDWTDHVPPTLRSVLLGVRADSPHDGADSLIVDAGPVKIMVSCSAASAGPLGGGFTERASFNFTAEDGHTYDIAWKRKQDCMELLDATADGSVVACEPYYSGSYEDLSTTSETASIRAGGASSNKGNCRPFTGERRKWGRELRDLIKVDAGPVSINARCFNGFFGRPPSTARFEFVAEAGHNYTITATEKDCISLLDITFEDTAIACEPYKKDE
jgi:hypothetical protein